MPPAAPDPVRRRPPRRVRKGPDVGHSTDDPTADQTGHRDQDAAADLITRIGALELSTAECDTLATDLAIAAELTIELRR
ncbi:hypothetical protein CLV30_10594 [Haloactinopolyspora alba]|uniref:Uncharacterized protein n=1 Tax=Haloactinopolyspora alba TaxID=648780 RepID=A0A2P8E588_9ACTN|nr:hypothetical protein [Haloactinopolyspora alba]PSL04629.1 hypothetical protein CLV30_10594 [Haloactinopolyspora alba]